MGVGRTKGRKPSTKQLDRELLRERQAARYNLANRAVDALKWIIGIAALWIPLQPATLMIHDLAGKTTSVTVLASIGYGLAAAVTIALAFTLRVTIRQKKTISDQRTRSTELEGQLLISAKREG